MTILERLKSRIETDLDDVELQLLIDAANQDLVALFGPHADPNKPITVWLEGYRNKLVMLRPIEERFPIEVTEYVTEYGFGETPYLLTDLDYRIWPGGRVIERIASGNNARRRWPQRVKLTYVPVNDGDQRAEVIIKLVILSIQYEGTSSHMMGDVSVSSSDYAKEREKVLGSLDPRRGIGMA